MPGGVGGAAGGAGAGAGAAAGAGAGGGGFAKFLGGLGGGGGGESSSSSVGGLPVEQLIRLLQQLLRQQQGGPVGQGMQANAMGTDPVRPGERAGTPHLRNFSPQDIVALEAALRRGNMGTLGTSLTSLQGAQSGIGFGGGLL